MADSSVFDHYQVLKRDDGSLFELGRGAMGITYKAFDTNLRVPVALKVINAASIDSDIARQRFVREARAAAQLRHRNVASVFHLGVENDAYFYAMEFIDGETVESFIRRQGPVDPVLALRIATQVARALNAAQKHGLVHRDIKPSNLMLVHEDEELVVKVIDFGLAKSCRKEDAEDMATLSMGGFVGTPHFASPEQLEEREIDVRSDIYSLGVTLWYMLAGKAPFAGSLAQVMSQHLHKPPPFEKLNDLPRPLISVLSHMLEKDPSHRTQSPVELRQELEKCIEILAANPAAAAGGAIDEEDFPTMAADAPMAKPAAKFSVGSSVGGRYELIEDLGSSNLGKVFRTRQHGLDKELRLVVLNPDLIAGPAACTQIEREVEKIIAVEHPHLLRVFAFERVEESSLLVLESTRGFSLLDVLRSRRELTPYEALLVLQQAAGGVDRAINAGLKQLDFSLHQIAIHFPGGQPPALTTPLSDWPEFVLKLDPLCITRELSMSETWAGGQTIVGGIATAQQRESGAQNIATKYIQSLSAVVYELLGGTLSPLMLGGIGAQPVPRYVPLATLTEEANEVVKRALNPAQSYSSAQDFFHALKQAEGEAAAKRGISAAPPPISRVSSAPETSASVAVPARRGLLPVLASIGVGLGLAGVVWIVLHFLPEGENKTEQPKIAIIEQPSPTPMPTAVVAPTPKPTPTPMPTPTQEELLKAAVADAEKYESASDWAKCIPAYLRIAKDFPEFEIGKVRLELLLAKLRAAPDKIDPARLNSLQNELAEAAQLDVISAMMILGEQLRKKNPAESFRWFSKAADAGHAPALTQVGLMYSNGAGVDKDLAKAVDSFQKAGEKGDAVGKTCLAECYLYGRGTAKNEKRAIELLQEAIAGNDPRAMNLLGTCYHQGLGTTKNFEEALRLFTQAKDLHFYDALGNLGVLYMNGDGVREDAPKAVELFEQGSRNGSASCMYLYARCLESGNGVPLNRASAESWYKKSAEAGNPRALDWCRKNGVIVSTK